MNELKSNISDDAFLQALGDIDAIMGNAGQWVGLISSIINARNAQQEYQQAQSHLKMVIIQREIIMRKFDSIDNFIRLAFEERDSILQKAQQFIKNGLKKKKQSEVSIGLQIIKAVLLSNPLNKNEFSLDNYQTAYDTLNSIIV